MYLTEENINKNPFKQFEIWFEEAKKIGLKDAFIALKTIILYSFKN